MEIFKEHNNICLTTVLLISRFSTFAVAVCTLPTELHNSVWNYHYTDLSNNAQTTTLSFGRTTLTKPSNIRLNALGTTLNAWTCISNLTLSGAVSVAVFKSDASYSDANGIRIWVYLCMKLTKVADNLFYFYLLSDEDGSVYPKERVYQSGSIPDNTVPVCSTFCQYSSKPRIRTLKKSGSSTTLPGDVSLCEPCNSACEGVTTEMTSLKTTQNTTLPSTSSEINITTDITSTETPQKTTAQSISTEMITKTETTPLKTTQQTTAQSTYTEMVTTTEMKLLETTQQTTAQLTSTEMVTTTELAPLEITKKTTAQSTPTEIVTTSEMTSLDTTQKTTTQYTSTDIETSTTEIAQRQTAQKTTLPASSTNLVTPIQKTTFPIMVDVTETNSDINVVNTDSKDKTTMDTQSTDTEYLKIYSGPIILVVIASFGFLIVIIAFVYLRGHSGVNTIEKTQQKGECSYDSTIEIFYLYQGKGVQTIAIQRIVATDIQNNNICTSVDITSYHGWIEIIKNTCQKDRM